MNCQSSSERNEETICSVTTSRDFYSAKNLYAAAKVRPPSFDGSSKTGSIKITSGGGTEQEDSTIKRTAENVEANIL